MQPDTSDCRRLSIITERNGDKITIKVNDTGKGMPPEMLKQLFTPFFTMKENGTGLGLVVCKSLWQAMAENYILRVRRASARKQSFRCRAFRKSWDCMHSFCGRHLCGCLFCVMEERKKDFPGPAYNEL
ncbi:ATP-binding protein [Paenibacillus alkaliterrae]|uniref:ATP-binding protein n=1 Tax=Paenibacillus alkaliterrae TaxID=320909 RepID=UPI0038B2E169